LLQTLPDVIPVSLKLLALRFNVVTSCDLSDRVYTPFFISQPLLESTLAIFQKIGFNLLLLTYVALDLTFRSEFFFSTLLSTIFFHPSSSTHALHHTLLTSPSYRFSSSERAHVAAPLPSALD
jgi:hypothetical protein